MVLNINEKDIEKSPCHNCFWLREKTEDDVVTLDFNEINISHWLHCNCGCIYCARLYATHGKITKWKRKSEYYDIAPVIENLYKYNLLSRRNLLVIIQGGDISVLKEFKKIMKLFDKYGGKSIYYCILSNSIAYQPIIRDLIKNHGRAQLMTSIDAGTRETYKKIKRVDKFDTVIKNIKKYCKDVDKPLVKIRYIIVKGLNDNYNEIDAFINKMADIGVKIVEFLLQDELTIHTDLDKFPPEKYLGDLYLHFVESAQKRNLSVEVNERTKHVIDNYLLK